jgi:hypothetical protein
MELNLDDTADIICLGPECIDKYRDEVEWYKARFEKLMLEYTTINKRLLHNSTTLQTNKKWSLFDWVTLSKELNPQKNDSLNFKKLTLFWRMVKFLAQEYFEIKWMHYETVVTSCLLHINYLHNLYDYEEGSWDWYQKHEIIYMTEMLAEKHPKIEKKKRDKKKSENFAVSDPLAEIKAFGFLAIKKLDFSKRKLHYYFGNLPHPKTGMTTQITLEHKIDQIFALLADFLNLRIYKLHNFCWRKETKQNKEKGKNPVPKVPMKKVVMEGLAEMIRKGAAKGLKDILDKVVDWENVEMKVMGKKGEIIIKFL